VAPQAPHKKHRRHHHKPKAAATQASEQKVTFHQ
jgi:hypothetical protein